MPQQTPLERELRERIARQGSLSFREVMHAALYDSRHGYYTNLRGFGAEGDFITSPERHPAFGWLLGRQALDVWEALDRPRPLRIVEIGGGSGALAESLMGFLREHLADVIYSLDEVSPTLRKVQQERLTGAEFRWESDGAPAHFIIANEVADALPVVRVIARSGILHELRVGPGLSWVESESAPAEVESYLDALRYRPPSDTVVDIALGLGAFVARISERLERGLALVLDYAASPPRDTLFTYYRHTLGSDPLVRLGQQDISAHVDFRSLVRIATEHGLRALATTQRDLLLNLGIGQVLARLSGPTDRTALGHLVDPNAAGGKILALHLLRDVPENYRPAGVVGRQWPEPANVPSLPPDPDEADFLSQWNEAFSVSEEA